MEKKYRLTDEVKVLGDGTKLYRIQALCPVGGIEKGALGGWVQSEGNLSQQGSCWVQDDACVYGKAYVSESAIICGSAIVRGNAVVKDFATISGKALICNGAVVGSNTQICDAIISGTARLLHSVRVRGCLHIGGQLILGVADNNAFIEYGDEKAETKKRTGPEGCKYKLAKCEQIFTPVGWCDACRVVACSPFYLCREGVTGGFVGGYENLSSKGLCWVYDDAVVHKKARVEGDASVWGTSVVGGSAFITDSVLVDNSIIGDNARLFGSACIAGSKVHGKALIGGDVRLSACVIEGDACIGGSGAYTLRIAGVRVNKGSIKALTKTEYSHLRSLILKGQYPWFDEETQRVVV